MSASLYRICRLFPVRSGSALLLVAAMIAAGGCQTTPTVTPPAPALQLVESQPLALAEDCNASGSYFVAFTVLRDGRAGEIQAPQGPACVQQALTAWVSTFRYASPGQETPMGMEWMMVTARRDDGHVPQAH
jgi:hypothetical protein